MQKIQKKNINVIFKYTDERKRGREGCKEWDMTEVKSEGKDEQKEVKGLKYE